MTETGVLQQLEISGFLAAMLIVGYGIYRLVLVRGFKSKCGWLDIDLRSSETRQKELQLNHELELARLEVEKLKYGAVVLEG